MYLSDGRCTSSSAEARDLMTITGHGPSSLEGCTHYHRQRTSHYCTLRGSENPLTYPAACHPCTGGAPKRGCLYVNRIHSYKYYVTVILRELISF
ncbi:hypothetical protein AVEN_154132-1 [Araneus ventricosus]|uniref:Uncharacterized protein n=1 Tax=Araneus ventricosus TaxID=182803 RepID=A0A4Y2GLZ1_ARAVE|nr:hypothetical protein AVEN_154132-1 [Araneus ventricosus]